jgi:glycosyltransferase involved in cell wall biosynthesis
MKIIICVTNDLNFDQRMIRIANSLSADHDVTLVGREKHSSPKIVLQKFKQKRLKIRFESGVIFYFWFNVKLFFYLLFNQFDKVYAVDLDTIVPCTLAKFIKRKESIFDAHEIFEETPELIGRKLKKSIWIIIAKVFIPLQNQCITVGNELKKYLEKKYGGNFHVIRNVPYTTNYKQITKSKKSILYQGALNEGRGLEAMIDAMPFINKELDLILIGGGDIEKALKTKAKNSSRTSDIHFLGYIHPKELKSHTATAFIGINLIEKKSLSYYYSLANKFFDYIQARVPSINMAYPEYLTLNNKYEVALLINNLDAQSIATAINSLHDDESYYNRLKDNCNIASKELCWEKEELKLKEIFN